MNARSQIALSGPFLILSAHDYRSPRQASIHFVTAELAKRAPTRFFSIRFSELSRFKADPRLPIADRANKVEQHKGVDCYLWKTLIHPFAMRRPTLAGLEAAMHSLYVQFANPQLEAWVKESHTVIFESGIAPIFIERVRQLNPQARLVYWASDDLDVVNVARPAKAALQRDAGCMDVIRLASKALGANIPAPARHYFIPHGVDRAQLDAVGPSPYGPGRHAVSVGSMLFDPRFFEIAAGAYPEITFHVIGCGHRTPEASPPNVRYYDEMKFADTLAYVKHADIGIAPYRCDSIESVPPYLADTSLKLIQYDYYGLPAVCPQAVAGSYSTRFAYAPGDAQSIRQAIAHALAAPRGASRPYLSWSDVADRLLSPWNYADTDV